MSTEVEFTELVEVVGALEIPCEYDRLLACGPATAEWVMLARCGCGVVAHRLACVACKDTMLRTDNGLSCPECSEVFVPARKAFTMIEPL